MPRPLKRGILGASTTILSIDIDKYAFMCGSNFYETYVTVKRLDLESYSYEYQTENRNLKNYSSSDFKKRKENQI